MTIRVDSFLKCCWNAVSKIAVLSSEKTLLEVSFTAHGSPYPFIDLLYPIRGLLFNKQIMAVCGRHTLNNFRKTILKNGMHLRTGEMFTAVGFLLNAKYVKM